MHWVCGAVRFEEGEDTCLEILEEELGDSLKAHMLKHFESKS